jgi:hypothetical protein
VKAKKVIAYRFRIKGSRRKRIQVVYVPISTLYAPDNPP